MGRSIPPEDSTCAELVQMEAWLLDQERYEEWLDLFASELVYWMPTDPRANTPQEGLNIVYDDRRRLTDRIRRLTGGHAHTEDPPRWVARIVTPGLALQQGAERLILRSGFLVFDTRNGTTKTYGGHYLHDMRISGGTWKIVEKKIELASARTSLSALTCLL